MATSNLKNRPVFTSLATDVFSFKFKLTLNQISKVHNLPLVFVEFAFYFGQIYVKRNQILLLYIELNYCTLNFFTIAHLNL